MTNREIIQVYNGINKLYDSDIKLDVKLSYTLAKNKRLLQPLMEVIENEQYKILKKYGNLSEDGSITVPKEKTNELNEDLVQLQQLENKVEITKIKLDDFNDEVIDFKIISDLMPIIIE